MNNKKNPYKPGDRIKFKDGDNSVYVVYAIYGNDSVSLGLHDYPDTEMDFQVNINKIKKA